MTDNIRSTPLRVLDLEFNPHLRSLDVGGQRTVLDSRSCSVFAALAEHLGDCVSKEELLRAAWPNQLAQKIPRQGHQQTAASRPRIRSMIVAAYGVGYILREAAVDHALPDENVPPAETPWTAHQDAPFPIRHGYGRRWTLLVILSVAAGTMAFAPSQGVVAIRSTPPVTHDAPDALATILSVDDHPTNNRLEIAAFKQQRIAVHLAGSTADALKLIAMNRYPLVISDLGRGEDRLAGLKMIEAMEQRGIRVPVVIYTMRPKDRAGQEAQRRMVAEAGAADLAVTPQEVRAKVLKRLAPST